MSNFSGLSPDAPKKINREPVSAEELKGASIKTTREQMTAEKKEQLEKFIDSQFERLILVADKINEGNNGLILKFEAHQMSPDFVAALEQRFDLDLRDNHVLKLLKIYSRSQVDDEQSAAEYEYNMQNKAFESTIDALKYGEIAGVPRPLLHRDVEISDSTRQALKDKGLDNPGSRAEFIMMDFVPGQDLAHILYKKIIKEHPKGRAYREMAGLDVNNFEDARFMAGKILGFEKPGGRHRSESENLFEQKKVEFRNADKVYDYLERHGHLLNPRIMTQIGKTIRLFHERGIALRDGHERNFMIDADKEETLFDKSGSGHVQANIIDYGSAVTFAGRYGPHLFETEELGVKKKYTSDEAILHSLHKISPRPPFNFRVRLDDLIGPPEQKTIVDYLDKIGPGKSSLREAWRIGNETIPENQIAAFVAGAKILLERNKTSKEDIKDYAKLLLREELADDLKQANLLRELISSISK